MSVSPFIWKSWALPDCTYQNVSLTTTNVHLNSKENFSECAQTCAWGMQKKYRVKVQKTHISPKRSTTPKYVMSKGSRYVLKKGFPLIYPIFLSWGWDWDHQSYSREGSGFLGMCFHKLFPVNWLSYCCSQVSCRGTTLTRGLTNRGY